MIVDYRTKIDLCDSLKVKNL